VPDQHNIRLPDGTTVPVPAWASETTLAAIKTNLSKIVGNEVALIKQLTALNFNTDEMSDALKEAEGSLGELEVDNKKQKKLTEDLADSVKDFVTGLSDTDKPLSSMMRMMGTMAGGAGKLTSRLLSNTGIFERLGSAMGGYLPGIKSAGAAAGALIGWNVAKLEQFNEAQQAMIDAGAIMYDSESKFNEFFQRTADVGIAYGKFVETIQSHGTAMMVFGNDVSSGADRFLSNFTALSQATDVLGDLGLSHDEMISAYADELEIMRVTGFINRDTANAQEKAQSSFINLMMEQTALANLTGESRSELLARRQAFASDRQVAATMARLEELGDFERRDLIEDIGVQFGLMAPHFDAAGSDGGRILQQAFTQAMFDARDDMSNFDMHTYLKDNPQVYAELQQVAPDLVDEINAAMRTGEVEDSHNFLIKSMTDNIANMDTVLSGADGPLVGIRNMQAAALSMQKQLGAFAELDREEYTAAITEAGDSMTNAGELTQSFNDMSIAVRNVQDTFTFNLETGADVLGAFAGIIREGSQDINGFVNSIFGEEDIFGLEEIASRMRNGENVTEAEQLEMLQYIRDRNNEALIDAGGLGSIVGYGSNVINFAANPLERLFGGFGSVSGRDDSGFLTYGSQELLEEFDRLQNRETGGAVTAGRSYIVGERGPERFTPDQNGTIDNAHTTEHGQDVTPRAPDGNVNPEVSAPRNSTQPIGAGLIQGLNQITSMLGSNMDGNAATIIQQAAPQLVQPLNMVTQITQQAVNDSSGDLEIVRQMKESSVQSLRQLERAVDALLSQKRREHANSSVNG
jgi:hypothetical protein